MSSKYKEYRLIHNQILIIMRFTSLPNQTNSTTKYRREFLQVNAAHRLEELIKMNYKEELAMWGQERERQQTKGKPLPLVH